MIQNGVTLHENSKRETYAFNAKCSTTEMPLGAAHGRESGVSVRKTATEASVR